MAVGYQLWSMDYRLSTTDFKASPPHSYSFRSTLLFILDAVLRYA